MKAVRSKEISEGSNGEKWSPFAHANSSPRPFFDANNSPINSIIDGQSEHLQLDQLTQSQESYQESSNPHDLVKVIGGFFLVLFIAGVAWKAFSLISKKLRRQY